MIPALSQVCSLPSPWDNDLKEYSAAACSTVEIWLGKLETYLDTHSVGDARGLMDRHGLKGPVASYQGGLLTSQGDARGEHWAHFARRLEICRELEIGTLVVACDISGPTGPQDIDRAIVSLQQAAKRAAEFGLRLALEFQAPAALGNNLETAASLVAAAAESNLGICFDAFHYYTGPSKQEDLSCLTAENLFHVQLCDLAGRPRELAADSDRILPGDGDFQLGPLIEHFRSIGYREHISVEVMDPRLWQVPPRQFAEIAMTALRKLLGQAAM